jgi:hypothetical protein
VRQRGDLAAEPHRALVAGEFFRCQACGGHQRVRWPIRLLGEPDPRGFFVDAQEPRGGGGFGMNVVV